MSEPETLPPQPDLPTGPEPTKAEPFWRQLPQLFFVPLLIVLVCVGIYAVFGVLGGEALSVPDLLTEIQTTHDARRRDQCAFELAMALSRPGRTPVPGLGTQVAELLIDEQLPVPTRAYLALALGQLGDEARPVLVTALRSEHGEIRAHAALSLGLIGTPNEAPSLIELGRDESPVLQKVALLALGRVALREEAKPDGDASVRADALVMGRKQIESDDFQVGWNAALILSQLDDASGLFVLRRMADREFVEAQVRQAFATNNDAEVTILPFEMDSELAADAEVPPGALQKLLVDTCRAIGRVGTAEDAALLRKLATDNSAAEADAPAYGALELTVFALLGLTVLLMVVGLALKKSQLTMAAIALGLFALCLAPLGDYSAQDDIVSREAEAAALRIEQRLAPSDEAE